MKNTITKFVLISILMAIAIPAHASVVQAWECKLKDGKTGQDAVAVSSAWLKATKGMKGSDKLKVYLDYPIAANVESGIFNFILVAPNIEEWAAFEAGYEGSAAAKADEDFSDIATCSGSSLWNSVAID